MRKRDMPKFNDLTGQKFGRLTVVKRVARPKNRNQGTFWLCQCECGNSKSIVSSSLRGSQTNSCGCLRSEVVREQRLVDLTSKQFDRLTVIKRAGKKPCKGGFQQLWECQCVCGNKKITTTSFLNSGTTKSCGCLQAEGNLAALKKASEKNMLPRGVAAHNKHLRQYRRGAKARGYDFKLTNVQFLKLTKWNCHYCGIVPGPFKVSGLDRVDNSKGYTMDNVVPCCKICNQAKHANTEKEYIDHCRKVASYQDQ